MSAMFTSFVEERLDMLTYWEPDAIVSALNITREELLEVPAFRKRAEEYIEENFEEGT
jgi:hypothetical protein